MHQQQRSLLTSRRVLHASAWLLAQRVRRAAKGGGARAAAAFASAASAAAAQQQQQQCSGGLLRLCGGQRGGAALTVAAAGAIGGGGAAAAGGSGSGDQSSSNQPQKRRQKGPLDFGSPLRRVTDALLVGNALVFALQWLSRDALTVWGAKVNSLIAAGQLWRLVTPAFLHTSLIHLAINSHALHTIGPHLELVGGRARFAAVYAAGAVAGAVASFVGTPAPSVGASAALFGLGAGLAVFYHRHRPLVGEERSEFVLRQLGLALAINLAYSLANRRVDNWGHLGGMAGGALAAWALGPRVVRDPSTGGLADAPPVPWLAHSAGGGTGSGGGAAVAMVAAYSSGGGRGARRGGGKQKGKQPPTRKKDKAAGDNEGRSGGKKFT